MYIEYKNLIIRNATQSDSKILLKWWNDGSVMEHAGFPRGLNISEDEIISSLKKDTEERRRLILEYNDCPIGEMSYSSKQNNVVDIGIKICDLSMQNKGLGKVYLSLLIKELFSRGYEKIKLDTNLKNLRAQHVYERLGFEKIRVNIDSWKDQLGIKQSAVDYELTPNKFNDFSN